MSVDLRVFKMGVLIYPSAFVPTDRCVCLVEIDRRMERRRLFVNRVWYDRIVEVGDVMRGLKEMFDSSDGFEMICVDHRVGIFDPCRMVLDGLTRRSEGGDASDGV